MAKLNVFTQIFRPRVGPIRPPMGARRRNTITGFRQPNTNPAYSYAFQVFIGGLTYLR